MKTRIVLDFVLDHDGDQMFPSFDTLDFIEGGLRATKLCKGRLEILPGTKLKLTAQRKKKGG